MTFFDFPFCGCNLLMQTKNGFTLPKCQNPTDPHEPVVGKPKCKHNDECETPCHNKFLHGCGNFTKKYDPNDYIEKHYV